MTYSDRWISCDAQGVHIRAYYFPWGSKSIPYSAIRGVRRVQLKALRGRARIWGTGNIRYWASLDPARMRKQTGFVLDLGGRISPFVTPDDPDAFASELLAHPGVGPISDTVAPLI